MNWIFTGLCIILAAAGVIGAAVLIGYVILSLILPILLAFIG